MGEISWEDMQRKMVQQLTVAQLRRIALKSGIKLWPLNTKEKLARAIVEQRKREWTRIGRGL